MRYTNTFKRLVLSLVLALMLVSSLGITAAQEATLPEATESGMVPVNDIEMYYATYGDPANEPLLLLHGGLSHADHFANQIPAFMEEYYVIAADSRGHGRSTYSDQQIGYALMASDVLALLDALEIEAVHLVGWSDGGIIGLHIAINNPERLLSLVAYGANYNPSGVIPEVVEDARFNEYLALAAADYARLSPTPDGFEAFVGSIGAMWAAEPNFTAEELGSITTPTLILHGMLEEAIRDEHALEMAAMIPNADMVIMGEVGHFAMWDNVEEFNHIILDFLSHQ